MNRRWIVTFAILASLLLAFTPANAAAATPSEILVVETPRDDRQTGVSADAFHKVIP